MSDRARVIPRLLVGQGEAEREIVHVPLMCPSCSPHVPLMYPSCTEMPGDGGHITGARRLTIR